MAHLSKAQKAKAATRAMPEEDPEFQIAPMIDILLVLLVFFMSIATDQVLQVNKDVILPVAKEAKDPPTQSNQAELMVNITWSGDIGNTGAVLVGEKPVEIGQLGEIIRARKAVNADLRVVIRGHKDAKYSYIRSVMAAIGQAGVPNVIFSAVDKEMEQAKK